MRSLISVYINTEGNMRSTLCDWMDANCVGSHYTYSEVIFFDVEQDAVLFTLRWL